MQINWLQYFTVLVEGVHAQKSFNMATDIVSVTDLAYFLNLASVLADSKLETIREYSSIKLFCNHPQTKITRYWNGID
jgi:hypothetical protein